MIAHAAYVGDIGRPWRLTFRVGGSASVLTGATVSVVAVKPSGERVTLTGWTVDSAPAGLFSRGPGFGEVDAEGIWTLYPVAYFAGGETRHGDPVTWSVGRALPRAFLPSHLADLVVWLRGDKGVTLVGAGVSAWADQSSQTNDLAQAVAGDQPTMTSLGGQDALLFTSSDYLHGSGFTGLAADSAFTGFVVGRLTTLGGPAVLRFAYELGTSGGVNTGFSLFWYSDVNGSLPAQSMTFRVEPPAPSDTGYAFTDTAAPHIWTIQHVTAGRSISQDGVGKNSAVSAHSTDAITQHRVGLSLAGTLPWAGEIAEIITYARALDLDELQRVHDYLGARYGITVP